MTNSGVQSQLSSVHFFKILVSIMVKCGMVSLENAADVHTPNAEKRCSSVHLFSARERVKREMRENERRECMERWWSKG